MNKKCPALLLFAATLALTACPDSKNGSYTNMGTDSPLPGDTVNTDGGTGGITEGSRGDFDPNKVDYSTLAAYTVHFAFDSSTIPGAEREKLQKVNDWMKANPGRSLYLAGHADKRGTPEYNRALGERRALSVREFLAGLGSPVGSLYTNSYGADRPAATGDTEDAYAQNRRVEIGVIPQKP